MIDNLTCSYLLALRLMKGCMKKAFNARRLLGMRIPSTAITHRAQLVL